MMLLLKLSLAIFIAGNLLEMGLRLNVKEAMNGLRNYRFVVYTFLWGFVLSPALAYGITRIIPLEYPYAMGLILLGMSPCAPFLPMFMNKAGGDVGYTAAFMLMAATGTVIFMPIAVPIMLEGLSVSAWTIAKPLLAIILLPLIMGMLILHFSEMRAARIQSVVKKVTIVFTVTTLVLSAVVYGKGLLDVGGSYAVVALIIFFGILGMFTYWLGFGLRHDQKIVLSLGMATRNLGAAVAPLVSVADPDERTIVIIVLSAPVMVIAALLATRFFGGKHQ